MAENKDTREREKIAREIEKTSESIRKKHRALKTGKIEEEIATKRHFEPLIEPLQKIVDNSGVREIKDEPHDNDMDVETSFTQKDSIQSKIKRKRKNTLTDLGLSESHKSMRYTSNDAMILPSMQYTSNDAIELPAMDSPGITSTPRTVAAKPTVPKSLENDDVFETTNNSFEATVRNHLQTPEGRKALSQHLGPLSQEYIGDFLDNSGKKEKIIDIVYGIYLDKNGMMLGNKKFDVDSSDHIIVDGMQYVDTPGL